MSNRVTNDIARRELFQIAKFYPTLAGLLVKSCKAGGTERFGTVWATKLTEANLAIDHFVNVCDEYASGEVDMPDPSDRLCRDIIVEVRDRMYSETKRLNQFQKYHDKKRDTGSMAAVRADGVYGWWGIELGRMLRDGKLTKEEHDKRFKEVRAYDMEGGPLPDWVNNAKTIRGDNTVRPQKP